MLSVWPLLLLSMVYLASTVDAEGCPDTTWSVHMDQTCVKVFSDPKLSWDDAQEACQKDGADLVNIKDEEMNAFVAGLLEKKERYWIGVRAEDSSGSYAFTDNEPLSSYTNWRKNEPKTRAKLPNCVEMIGNKRGKWKVKPCGHERRYICQKDLAEMEKWDDLKVTWGPPHLMATGKFFNSLPRTAQDALDKGYTKISDCDQGAKSRGARYVLNDDHFLVLLYDVNGYIAGIQTSVPSDHESGYPYVNIQPPFVKDGDKFLLSAYFVNPEIICTTGRSAEDFNNDGTGTQLYVQSGADPEKDSVRIPSTEAELSQTGKWTKGECMPTMGAHYWNGPTLDMDCKDTYPVFVLYNNGRLNAFGFFMIPNFQSTRLEHPPRAVYPKFLNPVPKCFDKYDTLTSMHIYLTSNILANRC